MIPVEEALLEILRNGGAIDPDELREALESIALTQSMNISLQMMNARHQREEAIDRDANPGMSVFYDALEQARVRAQREFWLT